MSKAPSKRNEITRKDVVYPIPHNTEGGLLMIFASSNNNNNKKQPTNLVIMCAGFPDDHSAFIPMAQRLVARDPNCMVGVTSLPGHYTDDKMPFTANPKNGFSFAEFAMALKEAVKALRQHVADEIGNNKGGKESPLIPLTGIFHDWGSIAGLVYANFVVENELVDLIPNQLVLFDVIAGLHPDIEPPTLPLSKQQSTWTAFYTFLVNFVYQMFYAMIWWIQCHISVYLAAIVYRIGFPMVRLLGLFPTKALDFQYLQQQRGGVYSDISHIMYIMYPYFNLWRAILTGRFDLLEGMHLPKDLTKMPVLFMYGEDKNAHFHGPTEVHYLQDLNGKQAGGRSKVVAVPNAGHWMYWQQADMCQKEVESFIDEMMETKEEKNINTGME